MQAKYQKGEREPSLCKVSSLGAPGLVSNPMLDGAEDTV